MDNQFNTPDILSCLNSMHILYTFAPLYEHEFFGKVKRMNRTGQDKVTCALKISIKSKKLVYPTTPEPVPSIVSPVATSQQPTRHNYLLRSCNKLHSPLTALTSGDNSP